MPLIDADSHSIYMGIQTILYIYFGKENVMVVNIGVIII